MLPSGILRPLSLVVLGLSGLMAMTAFAAAMIEEPDAAIAFLASAGLVVFIGGGLFIVASEEDVSPRRIDGWWLCALLWFIVPLLSAIPFWYLAPHIGVNGALFEATSAWTTSGASTISNFEDVPRTLVLWHALLSGAGGFAILVVALVVLGPEGIGGMIAQRLPGAPGSGTAVAGRGTLRHRVADAAVGHRLLQTARVIAPLCGLVVFGASFALIALGMSPFSALCIALSALSTSGFASPNALIELHGGVGREAFVLLLTMIGAMPFPVIWLAAVGRFVQSDHTREILDFAVILFAAIVAMFITLLAIDSDGRIIALAWRSVLLAGSMLTTSGFVPADLGAPVPLPIVLGLILCGGCALSTAGGMKVLRLGMLVREVVRELDRLAYPSSIVRLAYGGKGVPQDRVTSIWLFFMLFILLLALTAVALGAVGLKLPSAVFHSAAALANAGGAQTMAPYDVIAYSGLPDPALWVLALAMIIGRLELVGFISLIGLIIARR